MKRRVATLPHPARVTRVRGLLLLLLLLLGAGASRDALACDSTGCLLVTRSASGLLPRKAFRLDLSYRSTDDSELMSGSDTTALVTRPKVDFENGIVRPGFHQDLGGHSRFLQVDAAYGLTARTTLLASAPVVTRRSYDIGHPPVLTEHYETWGLGDTLVAARHSLVASPRLSVVVGAGLELPTGEYRMVSPEALFDIGILDPMLQPGSGSWDVLLSAQASRRVSDEGTDLSAAFSYQANTTNDLDYSYGDDAIASFAAAHPLGARLRGSVQLKWTHRGRSTYRGEGVESTGGTIVYAIPGFVASIPGRVSLYLFLPVPVYRYVNETQVAPRLSLVMGLARTF
jgi:hypothetical protein